MQRRLLVPILLATAALAACDRPANLSRETVARSLKGLLVYPGSRVVDMASGDSAGQIILETSDGPDTVASWFRRYLAYNHWNLENDAVQADGSIVIYARRQDQPLWIAIQRKSGGPGSTYSMTGAITGSADSAAAAPAKRDSTQRSGSSMSSKRIHRR